MKDSILKRIVKGKRLPLIGEKLAPIDYEKSSRKVLVIKPVKINHNEFKKYFIQFFLLIVYKSF